MLQFIACKTAISTSTYRFGFSLAVKDSYRVDCRRHVTTYEYIEAVELLKPINRLIDKSRNGDVCLKNKNVIEVLYIEDCPFWREVAKTIEEALKESKIKAVVKRVKVSSEDEAKRLRFPGSPTVRINGVDIDPMVKETTGAIGCRVYMYQGKIYEFPPKELIAEAVERLIKK